MKDRGKPEWVDDGLLSYRNVIEMAREALRFIHGKESVVSLEFRL